MTYQQQIDALTRLHELSLIEPEVEEDDEDQGTGRQGFYRTART